MKPSFSAHDDLVESRPQYPLACLGRCCRMRPGQLEIGAELHQMPPLPLTQWRGLLGLECGDLPFDPVHDLQRLVPASLQLAGYEAIGGIDRVILSTRVVAS